MDPQQEQRRKRLIKIVVVALACLALVVEVSARIWLAFGKKVASGKPSAAILHYYPELQDLYDARVTGRDARFDVLLLGDTTLCEEYGNPAAALQKELEAKGYPKVRIWNLAQPGDTSRDSLVKYRWLEGKKFDWVVVYQGIGDLRMNNVPEAQFKNDYSHVGWYNEIREMVAKPKSFPKNKLAAPLLWDFIKMKGPRGDARQALTASSVLDQKALDFGASLQSSEAFKRNIKDMVDVAKERREFLTLATFATFVDPKYSKAAFDQALKARAAGTSATLSYAAAPYAAKAMPCEVFGTPKTIQAGVRAQNEMTSQVAHKKRINFADLAALVPARGENFIDVCHLSPAGLKVWSKALAAQAPNKLGAMAPGAKPVAAAAKTAAPAATPAAKPVAPAVATTATAVKAATAVTTAPSAKSPVVQPPAAAASEAKPAAHAEKAKSQPAHKTHSARKAKSSKK